MKKTVLAAGAALMTFAFAGTAQAQESTGAHPYVGLQVGYHNLGLDGDVLEDDFGDDIGLDDSGIIYGAYVGADFDIGTGAVIGIEGNFNLGEGPIDAEYGVSGRIGYRAAGGTVVFARAGYQWINIDGAGLVDLDELGIDEDDLGDFDDTDGDFLLGVGADISTGSSARIRVAVDTVSFDTLRPTIGVNFAF